MGFALIARSKGVRPTLEGVGSSIDGLLITTINQLYRTIPSSSVKVGDSKVDVLRTIGESLNNLLCKVLLNKTFSHRNGGRSIQNQNNIERRTTVAV